MNKALLDKRENIINELKKRKEFNQFSKIIKSFDSKVSFRDHLYSGIWSDYSASLVDGVTWDLELVLEGLNKLSIPLQDGLVADICCGEGRLARYLSRQGFKTGGIDFSKDQIDKAISSNVDLIDIDSWKIADVFNENSLFKACEGWDISVAVTSAASVNCFLTEENLRIFFRNIKEVLGKAGCHHLLLPVFADEASKHFEKNFQGNLVSHPFKSGKQDILAWVSLLYDKDSKMLLQPSIATNLDEEGKMFYEFCYSQDRIWTNSEIEKIGSQEQFNILFSLSSNVISGGADQWPFKLIAFEF